MKARESESGSQEIREGQLDLDFLLMQVSMYTDAVFGLGRRRLERVEDGNCICV